MWVLFMKSKITVFWTIGLTLLMLLIPVSHAIENHLVVQELKKSYDRFVFDISFSLRSFLKKIFGFIELLIGIGLSIGFTQLLSLILLPVILEIGLGPIVFLLMMAVSLTIPFQFLNGICLLVQKQFSLSRFKTVLLTLFSFMIYFFGILLSMSLIPLK